MFSYLTSSFRYIDPGPLVDGELTLVRPDEQWVDALLTACHDPRTVAAEPSMAATTRQQVDTFLQTHPRGQGPLKRNKALLPAYHFWMHTRSDDPAAIIAGAIALRVGRNADIEQYIGHIGYHVFPPSRGHHYAERACRLMLPLARHHGINPVWITCNPDNLPSRRTCQRLGATLVNVVNLPADHPLYAAGDRQKCRFRLDL